MFKYTTAIKKMRAMKARKKAVKGGTGSGKTHGLIPILIDIATKTPNLKITVVAETIPAVKDGSVDIFKQVMQETNRWVESRWLGNPMQYTFWNKSKIQFKAFDTVGKAKAAGKRDVLFLNEGNHIPYNIADTLITRSKQVWVDYNPSHESWIETEMANEPNVEFITLTYEDNEALPEETLEEINIKISKAFYDRNADWYDEKNIKSKVWANWCYVYVLGELGTLDGVLFPKWDQLDSLPPEAKLIRHGLDFGSSPDPMACCSVFEWNDSLIFRENFYQTNMSLSELVAACKRLEQNKEVICDSSNPLMIAELKKAGIKAKPSIKGAGSIEYGIQKINEKPIYVLSSSRNFIKELRGYVRDPDSGLPIDTLNHLIDAARYAYVLDPKKSGKVKVTGAAI
jgi:phage terminase large subunit